MSERPEWLAGIAAARDEDGRSSGTAWRLKGIGLALRVLVLVFVLPIALRIMPVARLVPLLTPRRRTAAPNARALLWPVRIVDALSQRRVLRMSQTGPCLRRSLALYSAATRAGYRAQVVLGVRSDGAQIIGHAWLEVGGIPLCEPGPDPRERFVVMRRLPES